MGGGIWWPQKVVKWKNSFAMFCIEMPLEAIIAEKTSTDCCCCFANYNNDGRSL